MTNLYIKKSRECEALKKQVSVLSSNLSKTSELHRRKIASIERITSSQLSQVHKRLDDMEELESKYEDVSIKLQDQIAASSKIRANLQELQKSNKNLAEERDELLSENLKYRRRVQASRDHLVEKDKIISSLRSRIDETVNASKVMASKSSNLDAKISNLSSELELTKSRLADFQSAYAQLYANAVGADITGISITASTSVKSLQSMIGTGVTSEEYESFAAPISVDDDYYDDDNELITI